MAVLSVALHGAIGLVAYATDSCGTSAKLHQRAGLPSEDEVAAATAEMSQPNCQANAGLAAWASAAVCASPFGGDGCFAAVDAGYDHWLRECEDLQIEEAIAREREKSPVRIALVDDTMLDKLEPLPIEELLKPPPKPPDPVVQPQPQEPQPPQPPAPKPPEPPQRAVRNAQVVEITPPESDEAPDNARFVSEYNSRVKKETVARGSTEEMVSRPAPKELPVADKQKLPDEPMQPKDLIKKQPKPDVENEQGTGKLDMRRPGEREEIARRKPVDVGDALGRKDPLTANGLAPKFGERPRPWRERELTRNPRGEGGEEGERGRPKVPDLKPSEDLISRVAGGGSVDKLDGVESDESTALNSKRWKYAPFFNRLKRQVAQNWNPNQVYLARDPNGNVYGFKDRTTVVRVNLRKDGSLAGIYVVQRSGADFLDDEAVRAFRAAGPFPNPPAGLVDRETGMITFSFGFHFEIGGGRSRWKIFRYR